MKIFSREDFRDFYIKISQRGFSFILSKFNFKDIKRTQSSFNSTNIIASNWWIVPLVRKRWNKLITDDENIFYEEFISNNIFQKGDSIKLLSIGSGVCSHEICLAELNPNWDILCIDISEKLLEKAHEIARKKKLININFLNKNIYNFEL